MMDPSVTRVEDHLRGVCVGLLTPFDDERDIEHEKLADNAQTLYDKGVRTFLAAANISEYHSLSQKDRVAVIVTSVDALPEDAFVLGGVGGSTSDARELICAYEDRGVDAMMVMPPDHTYMHESGLIEYYDGLSAATNRPLVPYVRGFDPSVDYLEALTRVDGVAGIKYALEDPVKLGAGIARGADNVVWIDGLAEPFAVSFWAEGVEGFSAGVSNFRPEIGFELYEALQEDRWKRARRLRDACLPYQRFRNESGENNTIPGALSVAAVKKGLDLAGMYGGTVREPIRPLTQSEERRAERLYRDLVDEIDRLID
jgi:4-hydroxy-tetrahydrodipicolinate synthase